MEKYKSIILKSEDFGFCRIGKVDKDLKIEIYTKLINYNSGLTAHYEISRQLRERELIRVIGLGKRIDAFIVSRVGKPSEIQEVLDNGIIKVYSHETHKKITLFAPTPERLEFLYNSVGKTVCEHLLKRSEHNTKNGYNKILNM